MIDRFVNRIGHPTIRILVLAMLCLLLSGGALAQDEDAPLYFTLKGNLYAYGTGGITRLPGAGYTDRLSISPDGAHLVYRTAAPEVLAAGGPAPFQDVPRSIMLLDTASGAVRRITAQPPDTSESRGIVRDQPAFSPTSQQVAWWEADYAGGPNSAEYNDHRLMIYDIASGETTLHHIEPEHPLLLAAQLYTNWPMRRCGGAMRWPIMRMV